MTYNINSQINRIFYSCGDWLPVVPPPKSLTHNTAQCANPPELSWFQPYAMPLNAFQDIDQELDETSVLLDDILIEPDLLRATGGLVT